MLFDNRILNRWSDVLPLVQRIMMAEPNDVIGVSPAQLLFVLVCQKMSYLKVPIIARRFTTTAAGPMEVLNMDYEGPFPEDLCPHHN